MPARLTTTDDVNVLLLEAIHPDAITALTAVGHTVRTLDRALDEAELLETVADVHILGIRSKTDVTDKVLAAAPRLQAIGAFCIGTNQIDLDAASQRGIAVFNAPFSNTRSVVELALAEIIALTRRLTEKNAGMHAGVWDKNATGSHEVRGRRLGIVGYGNIGTQLSVLAESLGMTVFFYDTADRLSLGNARACGSLDALLESVDIVTLHVDGRPANSGFFGPEQFARMRPGSIFLNLSRGFVIDYVELRDHLSTGHLAGAAIDVFPTEPRGRGEEFVSDLRGLPNVILTPHIGGSTEEAQQDIGQFVAGKLVDFASQGSTTLSVNFPAVTLGQQPGSRRLAHVHRNTPGVLAKVNGLFGDHGVNINGQVLSTRGDIGYLLTDVDWNCSDTVLAPLRAMPETIGLRLLS